MTTSAELDAPLFDLASASPNPVVIESLEVVRWRDVHLLRARDQEGHTGHALVGEGASFLIPFLQQRILPFFPGKDARRLETLIDDIYLYQWNYKYAGPAFWTPVAWAESALLDLLGRATGRNVCDLLGGLKRPSVPVYISSLRRDTTPEAEVEWVGERLRQTNARAVKLKIGGRLSHNDDASPGRSERLLNLARQQWGPDVKLYVDANGSYDSGHAVNVIAPMLREHGVTFFEEPCPFEDLEDTRRVADALQMPVAGGEQDSSLPRFEYMAATGIVDILQPDMLYNGGFIRNHRVARIAARHGLPVTPHSPFVGPRQAVSIHYVATLPELTIELEHAAALPDANPNRPAGWYTNDLDVHDGHVTVPTGPGLGIEYADEVLRDAVPL